MTPFPDANTEQRLYVTSWVHPPTATIAMTNIQEALDSAVKKISDQHYEQSFAYFRLWLGIGQSHLQISSDLALGSICRNRNSAPSNPDCDFIYPTAHLIVRFANDVESDPTLAPHSAGLRSRLCARILREFFDDYLYNLHTNTNWLSGFFYMDVNLIAHCVNLGYMEETTIRDHILQSLICCDKLYDHQAIALVILFKIAGATFSAYVDPAVVDRCFELLKNHGNVSRKGWPELLREVMNLRECDWEGLPPPPEFATGKPRPTGKDKKDPAATPIAKSLGLPKGDLEPQVSQPHPFEPVTPEADSVPASSITPLPKGDSESQVPQPPSLECTTSEVDTVPASPTAQSPTISISTLSDFTIADPSDDDSPTDPAAIIPHDTFYLEDGSVEVLCGNTLFRIHISTVSFHSSTLRRMFTQTSLASAESPNGCPRIVSSDTATDFATLLKMIYLPGFPERNTVPDFTTFSSLLRITAKYELPAIRSQLLEIVRDAYPETFEGLDPSKPLGESIFGGPTPHPNEVLNLFVQQKLESALPMAYYMAARRGLDSLASRGLSQTATLAPETFQSAIRGLMKLREMELKETHRLILGQGTSRSCSQSKCPSRKTAGPRVSDAHQKVVDQITDSSQYGTKVLQVLSLADVCGNDCHGFCESCVAGWEAGHAEVRKKVWAALPDMFGLKG